VRIYRNEKLPLGLNSLPMTGDECTPAVRIIQSQRWQWPDSVEKLAEATLQLNLGCPRTINESMIVDCDAI